MEAERSALGQRIVVVGTTGSGKTTVARPLAALLGVTCVELDALNWDPGWVDLNQTDREEFRKRVKEAVTGDAWVVDGNYSTVRDLVWPKATGGRVARLPAVGEPVAPPQAHRPPRLCQRDSMAGQHRVDPKPVPQPRVAVPLGDQDAGRRNRSFRQAFAQPEHGHLTVLRHRSPREARAWLRRVAADEDVGLTAAG